MGEDDTRRFGNSRGSRGDDAVPLADRLLLSEPEVAALCGVSRHTVRRWKAAGLLRAVELPFGLRRNLYRRADVEAFLARARDRA
jgi:excisionase family DNA binding protein